MLTPELDDHCKVMEHFGQRIRQVLDSSPNLTQSGMAAACDVSKSAVTQWVNQGTKNIRPSHLFAAADYLGVSPRWLAVGKDERDSRGGQVRESPAHYLGDIPARLDRLVREEKRPRSTETLAALEDLAGALDIQSGDPRGISATALVLLQFERMISRHQSELSKLKAALDKAQTALDQCHKSLSDCRKEKASLKRNPDPNKKPWRPLI